MHHDISGRSQASACRARGLAMLLGSRVADEVIRERIAQALAGLDRAAARPPQPGAAA